MGEVKKVSRVRSFFINGALMTVCAIVLRSIAVGFNVYVANTAGAEAVGLYTLLSGVYGFSLTLALSGINLALVRLVSEALALGDGVRAKCVVKRSALLALMFGTLASALLFFLSRPISLWWLVEPRAEKPLKILAICLPFVALSSVFNGYFTALRRAYKSAASNLIEMAARIGFTVFLFTRIAARDPQIACTILVFGSVFAELCSFVINVILFFIDKLIHRELENGKGETSGVARGILAISLPVALTSYVRSALLSIEHSLIPKGLLKFGGDRQSALSSYGTLTGMALPVINFPYAIIGSFTSLLVPEVSESRARGEKRHVQYITYRTYQSCLAFAFCVAGIFFAFADRLGILLYSSDEAAKYIRLLSLLVPVMYLDTSTDAILKGLGEQVHCMKVNIADSFLSVGLVLILVPKLGIVGYIITIYIAEMFNAALSIGRLIKITGFKLPVKKTVALPLFSAVGAGSFCNIFLYIFRLPTGIVSAVLSVSAFVLLYFIFMSVTGAISDEDSKWIASVLRK